MMTDLGEEAIENAQKNGMWDASPSGAISDEQISSFSDKLSNFRLAYENFEKMTRSAKVAYVRRYLSFKKEETRQKDFERMVEMLTQNLKPTINTKG